MEKTSMIGKRFARLLVLEEDLPRNAEKNHARYWLCQCECGRIKSVRGDHLRQGRVLSCGCYRNTVAMRKAGLTKQNKKAFKDLAGLQVNSLVAVSPTDKRSKNRSVIWVCECLGCGASVEVSSNDLLFNRRVSCGCQRLSHDERTIAHLLQKGGFSYEIEKRFSGCYFKDPRWPARFDFFVNGVFAIECDGESHYKKKKTLEAQQERDRIKTDFCKRNGIPLLRIPYWETASVTVEDLDPENSRFRIV